MGFRFRRSVRIAPGVKVSLNKRSVGITAGTRSLHHTVNSKGRRTTTVGLPGTGLSYQHVEQSRHARRSAADSVPQGLASGCALACSLAFAVVVGLLLVVLL